MKGVEAEGPDRLVLTVDAAEKAAAGPRDLVVGGAVGPGLLRLYDRVDAIRVVPETGKPLSAPGRPYALEGEALARLLDAFTALAEEFRDAALRGERHGFANLSDLLTEIHRGVAKSHPCGSGLGLLGVFPDGSVALCHRFAESEKHTIGDVFRGIDDHARFDFLARSGVANKPVCQRCWARGLCAGGCYHEAMVRYGEASRANLHYCDWIRAWTDLGLRTYAEIAEGNPAFFDSLESRKA